MSRTWVGLAHQVGSDPFVIWALTLDDGISYELSRPADHRGRFRVTGTLAPSRAPLMKGKILVQTLEPVDTPSTR